MAPGVSPTNHRLQLKIQANDLILLAYFLISLNFLVFLLDVPFFLIILIYQAAVSLSNVLITFLLQHLHALINFLNLNFYSLMTLLFNLICQYFRDINHFMFIEPLILQLAFHHLIPNHLLSWQVFIIKS